MARLQIKRFIEVKQKQKSLGMTLIEVLIALAIVSIAMTAIIKASAQNIRSTAYLQDKTVAAWVGQEVLTEARVGTLKLPDAPDNLKQSSDMLGRTWYWKAHQERTANKNIVKILVDVFARENNEDDVAPLISFESYVYHEKN